MRGGGERLESCPRELNLSNRVRRNVYHGHVAFATLTRLRAPPPTGLSEDPC